MYRNVFWSGFQMCKRHDGRPGIAFQYLNPERDTPPVSGGAVQTIKDVRVCSIHHFEISDPSSFDSVKCLD